MENIITIVVSATISGLLATFITLWWQNRNEKNKTRKEIFTTLMAFRFKVSHAESVKALNCVQVVFYDCENVQKAWSSFKNAVDSAPSDGRNIADAHITLLEEISKVLKYDKLNWKDIKSYYYPEGLAQEIEDSALLRKAQIKVAMNEINNAEQYVQVEHGNNVK